MIQVYVITGGFVSQVQVEVTVTKVVQFIQLLVAEIIQVQAEIQVISQFVSTVTTQLLSDDQIISGVGVITDQLWSKTSAESCKVVQEFIEGFAGVMLTALRSTSEITVYDIVVEVTFQAPSEAVIIYSWSQRVLEINNPYISQEPVNVQELVVQLSEKVTEVTLTLSVIVKGIFEGTSLCFIGLVIQVYVITGGFVSQVQVKDKFTFVNAWIA